MDGPNITFLMQGRALSRLHLTKGPSADKIGTSDTVTSEDAQAAARSVQMTDMEAGQHAEDDDLHQKKRDKAHADGGRHVHMADTEDGGNLHGGKCASDMERKKKMWDDMLKRKLGADLEQQKKTAGLDDLTAIQSDEEDSMSRVNSQATLLGGGLNSSSQEDPHTLAPSPDPSPTHQQPPLEQPRLLSKKGLLGALSNSRRFLPALMKKDDNLDGAVVSGGLTRHSSGGLVGRMTTAGSVDSNAPLLPAGMPSGQIPTAHGTHRC